MKLKFTITCQICGTVIPATYISGSPMTRDYPGDADEVECPEECPECGGEIDHAAVETVGFEKAAEYYQQQCEAEAERHEENLEQL